MKKEILWIDKPKIVTPIKIVKLNPSETIIDVVIVNEYGTFPVKLAIKTKKNSEYIRGKYTSLLLPICSLTIEFILAKEDSNEIDHLLGITFESLFPYKWKLITINNIKQKKQKQKKCYS